MGGSDLRETILRRTILAGLFLAAVSAAVTAFLFVPAARASWNAAAVLVFQKQQEMQQALASGLRMVDQTGPIAVLGLVGLSFLYGVVHALGPGHGKAVVSAYVLADGRRLRKGLLVAWAAAALQALVAITLVTAVVLVFGAAARETQAATLLLERIGYGLVVLIGIVLTVVALRRLFGRGSEPQHRCHDHGYRHATDAPIDTGERLRRGLLVLSVGIRPCSGAVLVLAFAKAIGVFLAGILATIAMSIGTALTVSALALMTFFFRRSALQIGERGGLASAIESGLGLIAGALLLALGSLLLWGSYAVPVSPFRV